MEINLFEHKEYKSSSMDEKNPAVDLEQFLGKVWENRKLIYEYEDEKSDEEEEQETDKKSKHSFLEISDNTVKAKNYVGFIHYGDWRINVYPKIFKNYFPEREQFLPEQKKKYLNHLIYYLNYCQKIFPPFSRINFEHQQFDDLLDVFVYVFAHFTEETLSRHPYSCYEEITEQTNYLKGRLTFAEYIREDLATANWQRLHCTHEPFQYDNLFNQIVKYTTKMLLNLGYSSSFLKLESIIFMLDEVTDKKCTHLDCDKVKLNRLNEDLFVVLDMCRMFLGNQMLIYTDESSRNNFCFLLPMEKVFEDFLFGFIETHFSKYNPKSQAETYLAKTENGEHVFKIRNDIYAKNPHFLIDTKYRERAIEDSKKGVLSPEMYQVISYALKRECENIFLVYPGENSNISKFIIESGWLGIKKIEINALDIDICNFDKTDYYEIKEQLDKQIREKLNFIFQKSFLQ